MGILAFDPNNTQTYDFEYVPHRLAALELCVLSAFYVQAEYPAIDGDMPIPSVELKTILRTRPICSLDQFVGISIDAGLVALRTLLNFLGIKLDNHALTEKKYAHTIQDHGLSLISVANATSILEPTLAAVELEAMMLEALQTASKSLAHFTDEGATISIDRLGWACYAVSLLIRRHYFDAKGLPQPVTLIPNDMAANPENWSKALNGLHIQIC